MTPKTQGILYLTVGALGVATGCNEASLGGSDGSPAFLERSGVVSMEAESRHGAARPGTTAWKEAAPGEPSGGVAMQALPNEGARFDQDYAEIAARLDYRVTFESTGTHYVWIRGWAPDEDSATVHVGLDGEETETAERMGAFAVDAWTWSKMRRDGEAAALQVSRGVEHTINVWMREDGFALDKIVLTTDAQFVPEGEGPAESPRENEPLSSSDAGAADLDGAVEAGAADAGTDATAGDDAGTDAGMLPEITYEAEEMMRETYIVDPNDGTVIRIPSGSTTGTATVTFDGPDGEYAVRTHIHAESDGQPTLRMQVGDTTVYEETYPPSDMGMEDVELGPHTASLSNGDVIQLTGTADMSAWARIDKIVFAPPE